MRTRMLVGALAFLSALVFVGSAGAVNIGGTEYLLFGRCKIGLENGKALKIFGNVAVNEDCGLQHGLLHIGIDNFIEGNASANRIFFGSNSSVGGTCTFNLNAGGDPVAVCGTVNQGAFAPILPAPGWPDAIPLAIPSVTPGAADVTCTGNLPAGAYRDIRVPDGATCNILGTINARNLLVETQATLNGGGNQINLTGNMTTEPFAKIVSANVTSVKGVASLNPTVCEGASGLGSTAEAIETGNGAIVTGSVFYAPCARMHLHQGGDFSKGFEGIAVLITVEPVNITDTLPALCACISDIEKVDSTIALSGGCNLNEPSNQFFVSLTCATECLAPGNTDCTPATLAPPPPTSANATLNIPAVPNPGDYHVIVANSAGQYCTAKTVPLQ